MANIYKNAKLSLTTSGVTALYTVPSNSRAIVKSILIAEDANASATAQITLVNAAATAYMIDYEISLSAKAKEQVITEPLVMEESEILKVDALTGAVDVVASILEINREDR